MTGSPLLRLAMLAVVCALMVVPILRITAPSPATAAALPAKTETAKTETVTLDFTASEIPTRIEIESAGKIVTSLTPEQTESTKELEVETPDAGADLVIRATWATKSPHALRVRASSDDLPLADQTFWGEKSLESVLHLSRDR